MTNSLAVPDAASKPEAASSPLPQEAAAAPDRLSPITKGAYALGGTTDIFGHWLYQGLKDPVFNVFLGVSPTRVAIVRAVMLFVDACSGLFFGWLSDNTRSRWGRRRPYVLVGSILSGAALPCLFLARPSWSQDSIFVFMLASAVLYSPLIAAYNTPYQSLGAELTPDYDERTSVQAYKGIIQKAASALIGSALLFAMQPFWNDPVTGKPDVARGAMWAAAIAGAWMTISGIANYAFVPERYYGKVQVQARAGFRRMFADALQSKPYLVLLGTALVYAVPTGLVGTFGFYALMYHVFRGDMAAAARIGAVSGYVYMFAGFAGILCARLLAQRIGKLRTLTLTLLVGLLAFGSSYWLYTPSFPWLSLVCSALNGFSATGLWVVLPAMTADVVDFDELASGQRRESAYTATFSWVMKVGMMLSMLIGGPLLELTGFDAKLGGNQTPNAILGIRLLFAGIPVLALVIALVLIRFYPLDTERMRIIRRDLEARRGAV